MTVFLDANVLYAQHDRSAARHDEATAAMSSVLDGRYGRPITTEYVYDEVVTLTRARIDGEAASRLGRRIRGVGEFPRAIDLRFLGESGFVRALEVFEESDGRALSFTDATIVAFVKNEGIDRVLTFDERFDGLVDRLDPAEL